MTEIADRYWLLSGGLLARIQAVQFTGRRP
jgi:hypothetical protein